MLGLSRKIIVSGSRDARIAAIAACQRGRVSRRQLLAAGLTRGQIHHLTRADRLFREHAGVYAVGHPGPVWRGPETAALLAVAEGALLSHETAAGLWGLIDPPTAAETETAEIHVVIAAGWTAQRPGIRAHRSGMLSPSDRRLRDALPVCSPARALLDLAGALDERALARAFDRGQIAGIVRPRDIEEILHRAGEHPNRRRLRALLSDRRGFTRSEAEERLLAIIRGAGLPLPRVNGRLLGFEVDFHWPAHRLVVEVDGYRFHSSRAAFERDRDRDARLHAAGIEVMRVTWRQLEREPLTVVARIAGALARRSPTTDGDR